MNSTEMLQRTCRETFNNTDLQTICKCRGFPARAASAPSLFERLFASDTGVAEALAGLERDEITALHLLHSIGKPVDIAFFERVYPSKKGHTYGVTFTQRYKSVFDRVQKRLVRSGLLLSVVVRETWNKKVILERRRFALPAQFAPHLPPVIQSPRPLRGEGSQHAAAAREKLTTTFTKSKSKEKGSDRLEIVDGELRLGGQPFSAERFLAWQRKQWQTALGSVKRRNNKSEYDRPPVEAVAAILGGLPEGMWCDTDSLSIPLKIFCGYAVDVQAVCQCGWQEGCLAQQKADGQLWYRLAARPTAAVVPPHRCLNIKGDGAVALDMDVIPYETLEEMGAISNLKTGPVSGKQLYATPNLVRLGRVSNDVLASPLAEWLAKNSTEFHQAFQTVQQRRGKTILHENLSVARVGDLSLKVALEKALKDRAVSLGDDYIAFPCSALADVKRVVSKLGHVIKEAT